MMRVLKKLIKKLINKYLIYGIYKSELKNIKSKKNLVNSVKLTDSQKNEINTFFQKYYGKKYSIKWHQLYQSYTKKFDKMYFPEILFSTKLEHKMNDYKTSLIYEDKSLVEIFYSGIKDLYFPKTIVLNCNGIWYDGDRNIISKKQALDLLKDCGETIWKKTIDSSSGRSIMSCVIKNSIDIKSNLKVCEILDIYSDNFIVQEKIYNCKEIRKIYDKSLNSLRVITYTIDGKIYHVPIVLRIGQSSNEVDNIHAGGMFIGVSDDGKLCKQAFTEYQNVYYEHPDTHQKFQNYEIPSIDKVIEIAYKCHGRTPNLGLISWDFVVGDDNKIFLIEVNITSQSIWFPQMAHGRSAFGENTKYLLKLISNKGDEK